MKDHLTANQERPPGASRSVRTTAAPTSATKRQRPAGTQRSELGLVQPRTEPSRSATWNEPGSSHDLHVPTAAACQTAKRSAGASSRIEVRGKSRSPKWEIPVKKRTKNKVDSKGVSPRESHDISSSEKFEICCIDEKPIRTCGLAHVSFDMVRPSDPSITVEVGYLTPFEQLRDMEGMPDPDMLQRWLVADRVLFDCGDILGLVPDVRYVQAGLFYCNASPCQCCDDDAFVSVMLTPKGVMWVKKQYVPTPERHRRDYIPEDLRGPID